MAHLRNTLYSFFSMIFGADSCLLCGKPAAHSPVCDECIGTHLIHYDGKENRCTQCGKILISEIGTCMDCREKAEEKDDTSALSYTFPVFFYGEVNQKIAAAWKLSEKRILSAVFADVLYDVLTCGRIFEFASGEPLTVVPVPPRPGKMLQKGWDQIEDLCREIERKSSKKTKIEIRIERILRRFSTVQQKKLDAANRKINAEHAYRLKAGVKTVSKNIILLDDVRTTGATLEACALALKNAGAQKIQALVLFSVD